MTDRFRLRMVVGVNSQHISFVFKIEVVNQL